MKYAIMSDVHANPQALEVALADARAQGCTDFVMLGDTTGYGYDAVAALRLVRANFGCVLMGNHDSVCLGRERRLEVLFNPNYDVDRAQAKELSTADRDWLAQCAFVHRTAGAVYVHGELTQPQAWNYIMNTNDARVNFEALADGERLLFCGHTHHAAVWSCSPEGEVCLEQVKQLSVPATRAESVPIKLREKWRYIVNVGSVGYPRADFCSVYVIYDPSKRQITYRRLPFDFKFYVEALISRDRDLPLWLYDLLERIVRR